LKTIAVISRDPKLENCRIALRSLLLTISGLPTETLAKLAAS
jgi:hypothetical protein